MNFSVQRAREELKDYLVPYQTDTKGLFVRNFSLDGREYRITGRTLPDNGFKINAFELDYEAGHYDELNDWGLFLPTAVRVPYEDPDRSVAPDYGKMAQALFDGSTEIDANNLYSRIYDAVHRHVEESYR